MNAVKVSPKYQVVIPREVREAIKIHPGKMLRVLQYGDRIELIPMKALKKMRGFLKGIDSVIRREEDRI